jgi:hypothetical protein
MRFFNFWRIAARVVKRAIILFALGIMINSIGGNNDFRTFRIPGELNTILLKTQYNLTLFICKNLRAF